MSGFFPHQYFPRENPVSEADVREGIEYDYQTKTGTFVSEIVLPLVALDITDEIITVVLPDG